MDKFLRFWKSIAAFFPLRLLNTHLKKNQILLLFWGLLFFTLFGAFGKNVGGPLLLLDPEYMNEVNVVSNLILGIAFGIFTLSFFMTSYILDSHKFPFLATIRLPFAHFCLNNSLIPIAFMWCHCYRYIQFQSEQGLEDQAAIFMELGGFVLGAFLTLALFLFYFSRTNRSGVNKLADSLDQRLRKGKVNAVQIIRKVKQAKRESGKGIYYLTPLLGIKKSKYNAMSYDKDELVKIIDQHHLNAVIVEVFLFLTIVLLGLFKDNPYFQIPAMASVLLFCSFVIMFTGAFSYWFRGWAISGILALLLGLNFLVKSGYISMDYHAFGMNYETKKAEYTTAQLNAMNTPERYEKDKKATIAIMERWKGKFKKEEKPKMVFLCASGGGLRSAVWTVHTLQYLDQHLQGGFFEHTQLITGASAGLIGASYYRELFLQHKKGLLLDPYNKRYVRNMGKDLLNPLFFSMVVNDLFFRFQHFEYHGQRYQKGRGHAFEEKLNENLDNIFNKQVMCYEVPERKAEIPMLILSPTIINDGRKLHIAAQGISYMNSADPLEERLAFTRQKGIEFMHFFAEQDAKNLRFLSALRMSATFPYVTPNIDLPSQPTMEIMDAGLSDNFGVTDAVRYIMTFRQWIRDNTSGIVIVSIRDSENDPETEKNKSQSLWARLFNPIGSLYTNWEYIQDLNNETQLEFLEAVDELDVDYVSFEYDPAAWRSSEAVKEENSRELRRLNREASRHKASLSWRLTKKEKESIYKAIEEPVNQAAFERLKDLLRPAKNNDKKGAASRP